MNWLWAIGWMRIQSGENVTPYELRNIVANNEDRKTLVGSSTEEEVPAKAKDALNQAVADVEALVRRNQQLTRNHDSLLRENQSLMLERNQLSSEKRELSNSNRDLSDNLRDARRAIGSLRRKLEKAQRLLDKYTPKRLDAAELDDFNDAMDFQ